MSDPNNAPPFSRRRCPACGRYFGSACARAQHERDLHTEKGLRRASAFKAAQKAAREAEPSMADLVIEASVNRAAGIRNEDWIEGMFGDYL